MSKYKNNKKYKDIYKELIENGYGINDVCARAAGLGYLPVVKYLMKNEEYNRDPVVRASLFTRPFIGINQYICCNPAIAVRAAAFNGHLSIVQYLVEQYNADIRSCNDFALSRASAGGHLLLVKYLITLIEDTHDAYSGALVWASKKGQLPVVKYLIEKGANVNYDRGAPLEFASGKGHSEVVDYLIENGAN